MPKKYDGEERRKSENVWHQTKAFNISVILLLLTNIVTTAWWAAGLTKDVAVITEAKLIERVIKLEGKIEEHGKILNRLNGTLDRLDDTITRIDREQARRKSIVDRAEEEFKKRR